jgi:hypothetical protein
MAVQAEIALKEKRVLAATDKGSHGNLKLIKCK